MLNWWEMDRLLEVRMQERLGDAERKRLIRQIRGAHARRTGLQALVAAWLNGQLLAPIHWRQEQCCADARMGRSSVG